MPNRSAISLHNSPSRQARMISRSRSENSSVMAAVFFFDTQVSHLFRYLKNMEKK
jgi:hypothetical protein